MVHYSIQADHVHLIVEASGSLDPGRGMKAVGARKDHLDAPVPEPGSLALLTLGLSAARAKRA